MQTPSTEQQLAELRALLASLGCHERVDHHILHPGHQRQQLVRSLLQRMLGGTANLQDLPVLDKNTNMDGLAEDEQFAEKCRALLALFNLSATADQIRGCSGSQAQDTALLLELARLLQAMGQQRASSQHGTTAAAGAGPAPPHDAAHVQLLEHACSNLAKLTSDVVQLFAADMHDALRAHSDQGALQQLPQLQAAVADQTQQLQEQLQQLLAAGADRCEGAGDERWQQQVAALEAAMAQLLLGVTEFGAVYQQELSVWAEAAVSDDQQQQELPHWGSAGGSAAAPAGGGSSGGSCREVAEAVGRVSRQIMCAYRDVMEVLESVMTIQEKHDALQRVSAGVPDDVAAKLSEHARSCAKVACSLRTAVAT